MQHIVCIGKSFQRTEPSFKLELAENCLLGYNKYLFLKVEINASNVFTMTLALGSTYNLFYGLYTHARYKIISNFRFIHVYCKPLSNFLPGNNFFTSN